MLTTYKNLLPLANGQLEDKECVERYQATRNPIYLATVFTRHFGMILNVAEAYWGISDEDKASFCLEETHKSMLNFDVDKNTALLTFLVIYLKNRLRTETQAINSDKRKAMNQYVELPLNATSDSTYDASLLKVAVLESNLLTQREKDYCLYVMSTNDWANDSDFARIHHISSAAVFYLKQSLKQKINFVMA